MMSIIRKLFKKPVKEVALKHDFRLEGINPYQDIESLEDNKKKAFFVQCKMLADNEILQTIIDNELQTIANYAFTQSDAQSLFYARFEAKGVARVKEKLAGYAARVEEEETYDKHDYIPQ